MLKGILKVGIPNGVENGMFQVGKLLVARLVTSFGTAAIAANAISTSAASVVTVPGSAIGLAMITVVGQCMGARQPEQAVSYTKKLMALTYALNGVLCLALLCVASPLMGAFQLSPQAQEMAVQVSRSYAAACLLIWPLAFTLPNCLRAAGDAKFTMTVSLFSMWAFRIGLSYLFTQLFHLTLIGVWLAMYLDWVVRASVFALHFHRGHWKTLRLI